MVERHLQEDMLNKKYSLKEVREEIEVLSAAQLAGYSQLSEKTIRDVENGKTPGSNRTWGKIIRGLNKNPGKSKTWKLSDFK